MPGAALRSSSTWEKRRPKHRRARVAPSPASLFVAEALDLRAERPGEEPVVRDVVTRAFGDEHVGELSGLPD